MLFVIKLFFTSTVTTQPSLKLKIDNREISSNYRAREVIYRHRVIPLLVHFAADGMEAGEIAILAVGMFLLGALLAGAALVFYLRWFKKDN